MWIAKVIALVIIMRLILAATAWIINNKNQRKSMKEEKIRKDKLDKLYGRSK